MRKKKILIIDDEEDLMYLMKLRLEFQNYEVLPLNTSTRALEVAKREKPDLIILDIMMPEKNGYEICKELKDNMDTHRIPVILFTAKPQAKERVSGLYESVGADDYIFKDFELEKLLSKIKILLHE
ncbi:MAG: response regulator [Omnitrophica bacterium]|nr:response regulator [Candidatus Omnitrophota bacterium]